MLVQQHGKLTRRQTDGTLSPTGRKAIVRGFALTELLLVMAVVSAIFFLFLSPEQMARLLGGDPQAARAAQAGAKSNGPIYGLAVAANGHRILASGLNRELNLWDSTSGQTVARILIDSEPLKSVAISRDGRLVASGSESGSIVLWRDLEGVCEIQTLGREFGEIYTLAFSPDGSQLASAGTECKISLWDVATGRLLRNLKGHTGEVRCVAFSADGRNLISGSSDGTARIWECESATELRRVRAHAGALVESVCFSPDQTQFVSGGRDRTIRLWNRSTAAELRRFDGHTLDVKSVDFAPDGKQIVSSSGDKTIRLWDVASGRQIGLLQGHTDLVRKVAFSPEGRTVVSCSWDGSVRQWGLASQSEIRCLTSH
jgi:WD40 repeat protein